MSDPVKRVSAWMRRYNIERGKAMLEELQPERYSPGFPDGSLRSQNRYSHRFPRRKAVAVPQKQGRHPPPLPVARDMTQIPRRSRRAAEQRLWDSGNRTSRCQTPGNWDRVPSFYLCTTSFCVCVVPSASSRTR